MAEPFLTFSARRDLRETLWRARVARGAHSGENDNRPIAARIMTLLRDPALRRQLGIPADAPVIGKIALLFHLKGH